MTTENFVVSPATTCSELEEVAREGAGISWSSPPWAQTDAPAERVTSAAIKAPRSTLDRGRNMSVPLVPRVVVQVKLEPEGARRPAGRGDA